MRLAWHVSRHDMSHYHNVLFVNNPHIKVDNEIQKNTLFYKTCQSQNPKHDPFLWDISITIYHNLCIKNLSLSLIDDLILSLFMYLNFIFLQLWRACLGSINLLKVDWRFGYVSWYRACYNTKRIIMQCDRVMKDAHKFSAQGIS